MCSDAPDYSGMNKAAEANANISKEALDFYRNAYEEQKPMVAAAAQRAQEVSDAQLASMKMNDRLSRDYAEYQAGTFRPMERAIVQEAENYDTTARRDQAAGEAMADVSQQVAAAREIQNRGMSRMGVNPNDGKFLAMGNQMAMQEALGKASAATTARKNVEVQGYARRMDAANLGRGLASNQATSAGIALNAGNSSSGNAAASTAQIQGATQMMGQGFNTAMQGNASAGNMYGQAAGGQAAAGAANDQAMAGGAAAIGTIAVVI